MSTRGIYTFKDKHNEIQIYVHWDNYPRGAKVKIINALTKSWPLPRFEADEFAAAFVAANKTGEGDVRLLSSNDLVCGDMGSEYLYVITCHNGKIHVEYDGFSGFLESMPETD